MAVLYYHMTIMMTAKMYKARAAVKGPVCIGVGGQAYVTGAGVVGAVGEGVVDGVVCGQYNW